MRTISRHIVFGLLDAALVISVVVLSPIRLLRKFLSRKASLSVWTGAPIINMVTNAKAEKLLGARTLTVVANTYFITNKFDYILRPFGAWGWASQLRRYFSCLIICMFADRVHVYVDGGILPQRKPKTFNKTELCLYKLLLIPTFAWTYGADVRTQVVTRALGSSNCCTDCTQIDIACVCDSSIAKSNYEFVHANATAVFSMGDMIEYTPGSRNDLFFWPVDLEEACGTKYCPVFPDRESQQFLKVLHAPNHREFKGTRYIEDAVRELRSEGIPIELVLVERIPNDQAIDLYRQADLIVDQVMIGYHGYFALEAMALGKPVMCFIRDKKRYLLKPEECPIIDVDFSTIKQSLRYWAQVERSKLEQVGRAGRKYIEENYSLHSFAQRLETAYRDLGVEV